MKRWLAMALALGLQARAQDHSGHEGMDMETPPPAVEHLETPGQTPEGYAEISISAEKQQLIGVQTALVERARLGSAITASAIVRADEGREAHIHTKLMGWVDTLYVDKIGQMVKAGQPLYALYSQELYTAEHEFYSALRQDPGLAGKARERLRLWDVPEDQIQLIEEKGPQKTLIFRSPISGTVLEKTVVKGHYLEPDMMLFHLADLGSVWVVASVFEYEAGRLDKGGGAKLFLPDAVEPLAAKVDSVYPTVDPATRSVQVRLAVANPGGGLRPGAFVSVELPTRPIDALWIPEEAVVDTGKLQVAYLALDGGRFRPVQVQLGRRAGGRLEVRAGLKEGDRIVTGALFMLDSESRLRGTAGGMGAHRHGGS